MTAATALLQLLPFVLLIVGMAWFTRRLCRRALALADSGGPDAATGWFGFLLSFRRAAAVCWFAWLGGVLLLDPWNNLATVSFWPPLVRLAAHNALTILPPALIVASCEVMTFPVVKRLRGMEESRRQFVLDVFLSRLWLSSPAALMWTGFRAKPTDRFATSVAFMFMAAGLVTMVVIQVFWLRRRLADQFTPHALTMGELRDRAFAMAERAKVKLNQIYVYPMARWRLANAYANDGNNLLLTDWLLRHLSVREVDAIIGHELAHMKRRHPSRQGWLMLVMWLPPMAWLRWRDIMPDLAWVVLWFLASWHVAAWLQAFVSRRHEREADIDGVAISGDAEAFISGLRRVDQLNGTPHDFASVDQAFATHPSTRNRIEALSAAIGYQPASSKLPKPASPSTPPAPAADGYSLPTAIEAATQGDAPIFDSTIKHRIVSRYTMTYLLVIGVPPVGLAWANLVLADTTSRVLLWIIGPAVYLGLIVWSLNRVGRTLQAGLRPRILQRLSRRVGTIPSSAHFVGLSPGSDVRVFEGCYSWDLGFFWEEPTGVRFVGEQVKFDIPRDHIRTVRLGAGPPRWHRTRRVYLDWSGAGNQQGTIALACVGEKSSTADSRACARLADSIEQWRQSPPAPLEPGTIRESWALPVFGDITSSCPSHARRPSQFIMSWILVLVAPVTILATSELIRRSFSTAVLAVLIVTAGHVFATIPIWRFRGNRRENGIA